MRMVSTYEEFCELCDAGKINPDVKSALGRNSVEHLRNKGWKIDEQNAASDLMSICRQSPENFELAFRKAGVDFWTNEPHQGRSAGTK